MVRRNNLSSLVAAFTAAVLTTLGTTAVARAVPEGHPAGHAPDEQRVAPRVAAPCPTHVSAAGNTISHCAASADPYVPNLAAASPDDLAKAQALFDVVLRFCAGHPTTQHLSSARYRPVRPGATHWVSADARPGFNPVAPRAAVVDEQGKVLGVMYGGGRSGFPPLGSIPRPHAHGAGSNEMLHVWCTPGSLEQAFTTRRPDRTGAVRAVATRHADEVEEVEHSTAARDLGVDRAPAEDAVAPLLSGEVEDVVTILRFTRGGSPSGHLNR
ncbi:MAG: hypothetical protein ACRD0K_01670 [Egibacteraceae bacterium]